MNDGVNPSSIEEHGEGDVDRAPQQGSGPKPPAGVSGTDPIDPPELADPGAADQPAEGGRAQNEDGGEDFGAKPG